LFALTGGAVSNDVGALADAFARTQEYLKTQN
jgi:hypothetical protein